MKELKTFLPCWTLHSVSVRRARRRDASESLVQVLALAAVLVFGGAVAAPAVPGGLHAAGEIPAGLTAADWASLRGKIEASRYRAAADGLGGYVATNQAHGWAVAFQPDGVTRLTPRGPEAHRWRWGLRLSAYGYKTLRRVDRPATLAADEETVTYAWDDTVAEWWINTAAGLEQGFTMRQRPEGAGEAQPLRVQLVWSGNLAPVPDAAGVSFADASSIPAFTYAGLRAWDTRGRNLPTRLAVAGKTLTLFIEDKAATYPLTIDPWVQQAYLKASNTEQHDQFGISLSISGDTVIVGANGEDSNAVGVDGDQTNNSAGSSGAAYVFVRSGSTWAQQAYLKASNTEGGPGFGSGDLFGFAVAISGDTVVIGALNEDSNATGVNGDQTDNSAANSGAAYVLVRNGSTWTQQAYLKASNTQSHADFVGVAISGDTVVVGARGEDSNATGVNGDQTNHLAPDSGAVYVFVRNGSTWIQQAYIKASNTESDPVFGGDRFGTSAAISGDILVVGAPNEDSNATGVDGDQTDNSAGDSGAAYVFVRNGSTWTQQAYLKASVIEGGALFGTSVSISGDTAIVGAAFGAGNSGAVYVFARNGSTWSQRAYPRGSNTEGGDSFASAAVSGDTIVVGALGESSNATGVNGDQTNDSAPGSGAAYVFRIVSGQSAAEIPILGLPGFVVLPLALAAAGLLGLRRRPGRG